MRKHLGVAADQRQVPWPERLAWLPIVLFLAAVPLVHGLRLTSVSESPVLVTTLNTLFCTAVSFLVAYLSARSYLRGGSASVLFLGCGALVFAVTYMVSSLTMGRIGVAVAVHNMGVFLTGVCFLLSAGSALVQTRAQVPAKSAARQTVLSYLGALFLVGLVFWGAYTRAIPDFFIVGQGTTLLRQVVLAVTVAALLASAFCLGILYRRSPSAFLLWYSLGLVFVACGMGTVALESHPGTPLSWLGRSGQYLGGLYMLFAILSQARDSWRFPLEKALHESEERFRAVFERGGIGIAVRDLDGRIRHSNRSFQEMLGYSEDEFRGMNFTSFTYEDDLPEEMHLAGELLSGEREHYEMDKRYVRKDRSVLWVHLTHAIVPDSGGKPAFGLTMIQDITERKQAEQREKELEAHKLDFYRRTILAATGGKLVITESEEIERLAGCPDAGWELTSADQLRLIRRDIAETAESVGMDTVCIQRLMTCVGEATSNAIKHAGGGMVTLHRSECRLIVKVSDSGPGIDALNLPDVALTIGYTTTGTGGLGYKMMIAAAEKVYLATGPEGTMVATELMMHSEAPLEPV